MAWKPWLLLSATRRSVAVARPALRVEPLEDRAPVSSLLTGASALLSAGTLKVTGTAGNDKIIVRIESRYLVVRDQSGILGRFAPNTVKTIAISTGAGNDLVQIGTEVKQPAEIDGGTGKDVLKAGGGPTKIVGGGSGTIQGGGSSANRLVGGTGSQLIVGGTGTNTVTPGSGPTKVIGVSVTDPVAKTPTTRVAVNNPRPTASTAAGALLTTSDVQTLLRRAAAASASNDGIIAVVDRNGTILGVRTEAGVASTLTHNPALLAFAIDGAVSLARTGAFFASDSAPLTSRTVSSLSQSTITEREVNSNPNIVDPNSTARGPGYIAPVEIGAHFPPGVPNTPEVDLFGIEHNNRDASSKPGADGVLGTADDVTLPARFNIDPAYVPAGQALSVPDSYGYVAQVLGPIKSDIFQNRGTATLPGGIPLYKNGSLVGGIGVFFPGKTGFATEENSALSSTYNPAKRDRSLEAEFIAFAAAGGSFAAGQSIGTINGVPKPAGFDLPFGRIDLVGVQLDIFGPGGTQGVNTLVKFGRLLGVGSPDSGVNRPVTPGGATLLAGLPVPSGWLVVPHNGVGVSAADVNRIIQQGINQANLTRAAIRLPFSSTTRMVFAVTDLDGEVVGLYRMPDATVFSIDVAVAKARNVAYYADPSELQPIDQLPGVAAGTAFTNRTIRYLSLPRFPSTADGSPPGPFSILVDGGASPLTGREVGAPLPASAFQSVYGHDSFFPGTNFHETANPLNQNGIVYFPGSAPLYRAGRGLIGGFGTSGDGVDQDDVVTIGGQYGFNVVGAVRADQVFFKGVRLPYQQMDRNPGDL